MARVVSGIESSSADAARTVLASFGAVAACGVAAAAVFRFVNEQSPMTKIPAQQATPNESA